MLRLLSAHHLQIRPTNPAVGEAVLEHIIDRYPVKICHARVQSV